MQTGIKKLVKIIMDNERPSTPKLILKLGNESHAISSRS
jgi:hypothetical protein